MTDERIARLEENLDHVRQKTDENAETLEEIRDEVHAMNVEQKQQKRLRGVAADAAKIVSGGGVLAVIVNTILP